MRNYHYFRNAFTLGTGLTALFLVLRCSVPERDYTELGIGETAGSGGGGSSGDGTGGTSAGQGGSSGSEGLGGLSGLGGQAGEPPVEPIPCNEDRTDAGIDAGGTDAGSTDAGSTDAGTDAGIADAPCECVNGFIRAVDADGDGEGTRECSVAPGLDCDDGDEAVTHNSCNGCTALPNELGEDCLDCGAYICDGKDAVVCATKPNPTVIDPDCECRDALIVARDTDEDGEGTRLCEANPGIDCSDGNGAFITNQCGGCDSLPGTVGAACGECGVYACNGGALACVPSTGAAGRRCLDGNTRQNCVGTGFWSGDTDCTNVCYAGACEVCTPGDFRCVPFNGDFLLERCGNIASSSASSATIGWGSYDSCIGAQTCNANAGTCVGYLLLPRDHSFDVLPPQRGGLPWHDVLNTASDSDYG